MAKDDSYFQFPICLLTFAPNEPWERRLSAIIRYAIIEFARKTGILTGGASDWRGMNATDAEAAMEKLRQILKFNSGNLKTMVDDWKSTTLHVEEFLRRHPRGNVQVRVRSDLMFQSRDEVGLSERELRILIGVYSAIGGREVACVPLETIGYRACGCGTKAIFDAETTKPQTFTRKQLRATVRALEWDSWFVAAVFNRRQKFYSNSLHPAELRQKIIELKTRRATRTDEQRAADTAMTNAILAARATQGHAVAEKGPK
jgi:hypothetical protein